MNKLYQHRYIIRRNLIALIGICLCLYFSYHTLQGNRSYLRLLSVNKSTATLSLEYDSLHTQRLEIEEKVVMMRPGSVNRDLLEERVRTVLGYKHPDDMTMMSN